jgi:hypothetical protein
MQNENANSAATHQTLGPVEPGEVTRQTRIFLEEVLHHGRLVQQEPASERKE